MRKTTRLSAERSTRSYSVECRHRQEPRPDSNDNETNLSDLTPKRNKSKRQTNSMRANARTAAATTTVSRRAKHTWTHARNNLAIVATSPANEPVPSEASKQHQVALGLQADLPPHQLVHAQLHSAALAQEGSHPHNEPIQLPRTTLESCFNGHASWPVPFYLHQLC